MVLAKDRGDPTLALGHARDAARLIAGYYPRTIEMLLDVTTRLSEGTISRAAGTAMALGLLKNLNPILRQTPETDTTTLGVYLRAHRHVQLADGSDVSAGLSRIQEMIDRPDIYPERKFFIHLRLAREFGGRLGRTEVRPRFEDIWRSTGGLTEISVDHFPIYVEYEADRYRRARAAGLG